MKQWQTKFINALKSGASEDDALAAAKATRAALTDARQKDVGFRNALAILEQGVGLAELNADELRRLRKAQVSENRAAAYFGMTVKEFREALEKDEELRRTYELAPLAGLAELEMMQWASAPESTDLQKWLGTQHLGQSAKVEQTTEVNIKMDRKELAKRLSFALAQNGMVIDGISQEVLAVEDQSEDNDVGPTVSLEKPYGEYADPDCAADTD